MAAGTSWTARKDWLLTPHSNLYVANDGGFISKFSPNGTFLGQFGDSSYLTGPDWHCL